MLTLRIADLLTHGGIGAKIRRFHREGI